MASSDCESFKNPKLDSLKNILEEMYKLQDSDFKQKVFDQLKKELQPYCGDTYLDAFYGVQGSGGVEGQSHFAGSSLAFTSAGKFICYAIVNTPSWDGRSDNRHSDHPDCIQKYAEALKACLPKLFSALLFLFFNVAKDCAKIKGGQWNSLSVKNTGQKLGEWLTEDHGLTGFIKRGYQSRDLHPKNTGQKVAEELKRAVSLTNSASLQNVLCGLLFVCTWDPALTGNAICFLHQFCYKVNNTHLDSQIKKKFHDNSNVFKGVCKDLVQHIGPFVNSTSGLFAVCQMNSSLYDNLFKDDSFGEYCGWLEKHLDSIIASLGKMYSDCSVWSAESLQAASTFGPFKYGFVFTDGWENQKGEVGRYISALTDGGKGSLKELEKCLKGESLSHIYQSPEASTEAITQEPTGNSGVTAAGASVGVLSLGGAGVGAAYGFNLFGLKDIMSGVFGAIRGLVVGF